MKPEVAEALVEINRRFYGEFAGAFAATRRRIQPGVRAVLAELPDAGEWLDLGCGSGWLAIEWLRSRRQGTYLGLDFSAELLAEARVQVVQEGGESTGRVRFVQADLSQPGWEAGLGREAFAGGLCFAVLHHLPDAQRRLAFLRAVWACIRPGGRLAVSVWQFQHSPKLWGRRLSWSKAGLSEEDLEAGDTLLDWRYALPGQAQTSALRYVHLFSPEELSNLAQLAGFQPERTFESDGEGGRLGLYQLWIKEADRARIGAEG